ncbi:MAG: hypothetical protein PHF00_10990 [Elusimicrobia bacterium]|nr:hypothetical protein [Elusimicrobiota bacterium]
MVMTCAALVFAGSLAAAADRSQWLKWRDENDRLASRILDVFPNEPDHSHVAKFLSDIQATIVGAEGTVSREAIIERSEIAKARTRRTITDAEADAEMARLNKSEYIHLCYIQGSLVPRIYTESFAPHVPASLSAEFKERMTRSEYLTLLRLEPMLMGWGGNAPGNLSTPLPSSGDGR